MSTPGKIQFRYGQNEVAAICATPPREEAEHHILVNNPPLLYGMGGILRRYAKLPHPGPMPFSMEHYVTYYPDQYLQFDIDAGYHTLLATTRYRAKTYRKAGAVRVKAVGYTLHYAIRLYERLHGPLPKPEQRQGTLVFPHKSGGVIRDRIFDHSAFIAWLRELPQEYHPVHVCIYWKDFQKGDAEPFEAAGFPVVSCGHWLHEDFYLRLVDLCSHFRYACANALGSSFLASVLCGCHFIYHQIDGFTEYAPEGVKTFTSDPVLQTPIGQQTLPITVFPPVPAHRKAQFRLARAQSGARSVYSAWRFRWLIQREEARLAATRGDGIDFSQCAATWKEMRPWYPEGIELDGWMHPRVTIVIPHLQAPSAVVLEMELPGWSELEFQFCTVAMPNGKDRQFKLHPGSNNVTIPVPAAKSDFRLVLTFASTFAIPGEIRSICCRLLRFSHRAVTEPIERSVGAST